MTTNAQTQIRPVDIRHLINVVPKYPVSVKNLIHIASRKKLSPDIINFYRGFSDTVTFYDADDIVSRSRAISILRDEENDQPPEDQIRGAED